LKVYTRFRTRPLPIAAAIIMLTLAGCAAKASAPQTPSAANASPANANQNAPAQPALAEPFASALSRWNYYRTSAGVPALVVKPELSEAAVHHSRYLVKNHVQGGTAVLQQGHLDQVVANPGSLEESVGNQFYTEDGAKWSQASNVIRSSLMPPDGAPIVDDLMSTGFIAMNMMSPQLAAVGFGNYCSEGDCATTIVFDVGLTKSEFLALYHSNGMAWNPQLGKMPFTRAPLRSPIEFPAKGTQLVVTSFDSTEMPNLFTNCPGYYAPSGPAVFIALGGPPGGGDDDVKVASSSISQDGNPLESCAFDATNYTNPDGYQQRIGRELLRSHGAVILVPRQPLEPGHTYTVSFTTASGTNSWSFSVAPAAR
jgi:hypothetical protein